MLPNRKRLTKPALLLIVLSFGGLCRVGGAASTTAGPENFLYTSSDGLSGIKDKLNRQDIHGVQIVYNWKDLEPAKDRYNFSAITDALQLLAVTHKKLFIQVQDRFFQPSAKNVPGYLMKGPIYGGGITPQYDNPGMNKPVTMGWVALQWNPNVRRRYQKLLQRLGEAFDGKVYGVNLPETAIDIDMKHDRTGFSCDKYFDAEMENLQAARKAFGKSYVVQYVNFWPCEWNNSHNYMGRLFAYAAANNIGLGGPDIVPNRKAQMKNSYPLFHRYKGKLALVAMAVQEPTLTYIDPKTEKPFTRIEFQDFGEKYLGANIIFWTTEAPWLKNVHAGTDSR